MRTLTTVMRMHTQSAEGARVKLRVTQFRQYSKRRGLNSALARAQHVGVHHATVGRIEKGTTIPSERFIAQVLTAFPEAKFEDLFEIAEEGEDTTSLRPAS